MKYLAVAAALLLLLAVQLLREIHLDADTRLADDPASSATTRSTTGASNGAPAHVPELAPASGEPSVAASSVAPPLGGVRAWSPTAAPSVGPDPFAPVAEVRSEADTREGLAR
jgi:hypothetical protein